jgi:hypothetical protein
MSEELVLPDTHADLLATLDRLLGEVGHYAPDGVMRSLVAALGAAAAREMSIAQAREQALREALEDLRRRVDAGGWVPLASLREVIYSALAAPVDTAALDALLAEATGRAGAVRPGGGGDHGARPRGRGGCGPDSSAGGGGMNQQEPPVEPLPLAPAPRLPDSEPLADALSALLAVAGSLQMLDIAAYPIALSILRACQCAADGDVEQAVELLREKTRKWKGESKC